MLSLMTTYEVNDDTDAADLDVRSVMELDAAGSEVGIMELAVVVGHVAGEKVLIPQGMCLCAVCCLPPRLPNFTAAAISRISNY